MIDSSYTCHALAPKSPQTQQIPDSSLHGSPMSMELASTSGESSGGEVKGGRGGGSVEEILGFRGFGDPNSRNFENKADEKLIVDSNLQKQHPKK